MNNRAERKAAAKQNKNIRPSNVYVVIEFFFYERTCQVVKVNTATAAAAAPAPPTTMDIAIEMKNTNIAYFVIEMIFIWNQSMQRPLLPFKLCTKPM